jgi:hypothetical protein
MPFFSFSFPLGLSLFLWFLVQLISLTHLEPAFLSNFNFNFKECACMIRFFFFLSLVVALRCAVLFPSESSFTPILPTFLHYALLPCTPYLTFHLHHNTFHLHHTPTMPYTLPRDHIYALHHYIITSPASCMGHALETPDRGFQKVIYLYTRAVTTFLSLSLSLSSHWCFPAFS